MTLALHFGVYPRDLLDPRLSVDNHEDAGSEHPFLLPTYTHGNYAAFVSGSWGCWGPADQDSDGDESLHVLVVLGTADVADSVLVQDVLLSLHDTITLEGRVLDYAWVTTAEDWGDTQAIATFTPSGIVYVNRFSALSAS